MLGGNIIPAKGSSCIIIPSRFMLRKLRQLLATRLVNHFAFNLIPKNLALLARLGFSRQYVKANAILIGRCHIYSCKIKQSYIRGRH